MNADAIRTVFREVCEEEWRRIDEKEAQLMDTTTRIRNLLKSFIGDFKEINSRLETLEAKLAEPEDPCDKEHMMEISE